MAGCIASMTTWCGTLHLFSQDALNVVLEKIAERPPNDVGGDAHLFEGYDAEQWAKFAQMKSKIVSSICRENGRLKSRLQDPMESNDPWSGKGSKLDIGATESKVKPRWKPCGVHKAGCKSDTEMTLNDSLQMREVAPPIDKDLDDGDILPILESFGPAPLISQREAQEIQVSAQLTSNPIGNVEQVVHEPMAGDVALNEPDPVLYDENSKNWEKKKLFKSYGKLSGAAEATLCDWLKARYFGKNGKRTNKLDWLFESLTHKEMHAALEFCKSKDAKDLDVPCYMNTTLRGL